MLTNFDLSLLMGRYIKNSISFMEQKGYILPTLFVLNRGKPIDIDISHEHILDITDSEDQGDFVGVQKDIYESAVAFRLSMNYRDTFLSAVANKIAREYQPDAIGTLSACMMRQYTPEEFRDVKKGSVQEDPKAARILYASYYLKEDPKAYYMLTPYIMEEVEELEFDRDKNFNVHVIPETWKVSQKNDGVIQILPNPFK